MCNVHPFIHSFICHLQPFGVKAKIKNWNASVAWRKPFSSLGIPSLFPLFTWSVSFDLTVVCLLCRISNWNVYNFHFLEMPNTNSSEFNKVRVTLRNSEYGTKSEGNRETQIKNFSHSDWPFLELNFSLANDDWVNYEAHRLCMTWKAVYWSHRMQ